MENVMFEVYLEIRLECYKEKIIEERMIETNGRRNFYRRFGGQHVVKFTWRMSGLH